MPPVYPTTLDSFGSVADNVDTVSAAHVNILRRAVEALETKVGVDNSSDSNSLDYKVRHIGESYGAPSWANGTNEVLIQLRRSDGQSLTGYRPVQITISTSNTDPMPADVGSKIDVLDVVQGRMLPLANAYTFEAISDSNGMLRVTITPFEGVTDNVYLWLSIGGQVFISPAIPMLAP